MGLGWGVKGGIPRRLVSSHMLPLAASVPAPSHTAPLLAALARVRLTSREPSAQCAAAPDGRNGKRQHGSQQEDEQDAGDGGQQPHR